MFLPSVNLRHSTPCLSFVAIPRGAGVTVSCHRLCAVAALAVASPLVVDCANNRRPEKTQCCHTSQLPRAQRLLPPQRTHRCSKILCEKPLLRERPIARDPKAQDQSLPTSVPPYGQPCKTLSSKTIHQPTSGEIRT